ncbi:hypothetical protein OG225_11660 [Nocardia sp. NBC_01377]|uniref:hypothetical protein n=1 Tax=Nocardia sp. NBC_01377 TaxID=2903595 RepID=UPI0032433E0E
MTVPDPAVDAGSVAGVPGAPVVVVGGDDAGADGAVVFERGADELTVEPDCDVSACDVLVAPPSHAATAATAQTMNAVFTNR